MQRLIISWVNIKL